MLDILLEDEFYSKKFYFSYSGLNKLLFSPSVFYRHYILNQQEDKTDAHLIEGRLMHCLLLDEASFDKQFVIMPGNVPTGPTKLILDAVYRKALELDVELDLNKLSDPILDAMKEFNFHQRLKTDQQRLDKIVTDDSISYFQFLTAKKNRDIIDDDTLARIKSYIEVITSNSKIMHVFNGLPDKTVVKIGSEVPLSIELPGYGFGIKGIVDRIIEYDNYVHVIDFKTTNKTLAEFKETVEYYSYWLQAAIYLKLVRSITDKPIKFSFVAIDKYKQLYEFEVSTTTMLEWTGRMAEKMAIAKYHYDTRQYHLPYEFAINQVKL
ncbi:hypothetical protein EB118_06625 [bacterium]|nr:hypothetical protein [bacterium]NDD82701.1 hypothetical protein [bacterium]NDG29753.1 hypothetical protein [bacterium]